VDLNDIGGRVGLNGNRRDRRSHANNAAAQSAHRQCGQKRWSQNTFQSTFHKNLPFVGFVVQSMNRWLSAIFGLHFKK
jgi:hypothetical protein